MSRSRQAVRSPSPPSGGRKRYRVGPKFKLAQDFDCKSLLTASSWPNFWGNPVTFTLWVVES
jgi:hypothetical protein